MKMLLANNLADAIVAKKYEKLSGWWNFANKSIGCMIILMQWVTSLKYWCRNQDQKFGVDWEVWCSRDYDERQCASLRILPTNRILAVDLTLKFEVLEVYSAKRHILEVYDFVYINHFRCCPFHPVGNLWSWRLVPLALLDTIVSN